MTQKLGIDVKKVKLDAALLRVDGKYQPKVFSNNTAGFKSLLQWKETNVATSIAGVHACIEATGAYHEDLTLFLLD